MAAKSGGIRAWKKAVDRALAALAAWPSTRVQLLHHNDTDGITAAAILSFAFERQGYRVQRLCLEKPYPQVLERVYTREGGIIVLADFAGRIAPRLVGLNQGRNLTLILDHHVAFPADDPSIHNLDPDLYGLKGDRDVSASTTCYLFARHLSGANADLAGLAVLGAVGDDFTVNGRLVGPNRAVAIQACRDGRVRINTRVDGEEYFLLSGENEWNCRSLAADLDVLGGAGYYQGGPELGVALCRRGPSAQVAAAVTNFRSIQRKIFAAEIGRLQREGWRLSPHIQWFHVEDRLAPMGVKMIGALGDEIKTLAFIDQERYIAGFQRLPDFIPGFGQIDFAQVKVSMRVPPRLQARIRAGGAMGLDVLLPAATDKLGGFSDACHSLTAATTIAAGLEQQLIDAMEAILTAAAI